MKPKGQTNLRKKFTFKCCIITNLSYNLRNIASILFITYNSVKTQFVGDIWNTSQVCMK